MLCVTALFAQAPNKFTYQAVVRNTSNQLITNTLVGIRVSILQNSATGSVVYSETQMLSTNANGLVTMNIGEGTVVYGSFNNIDWSAGTFFLKSEIDPTGGSNYTISSTQQLLSVPYALYANEAGNSFSGNYNDLTNKPTIPAAANNATLTIQRNNSTVGTFTADASSDKTVTLGIISYFGERDGYQIHWWDDAGNSGEVDTVSTGSTVQKSVGAAYWGGAAQTFYTYTAAIPASATGFRPHKGDFWPGENGPASASAAYLFNYDGDKVLYE